MNTSQELLSEFIRCQPVTRDLDAVNAATALLKNYLEEHQLYVELERFRGRDVLFASTTEKKRPEILFNAHLDVVPAEEPDAFEPKTENGWLYARGAADCLGNSAVIAAVLTRVRETADAGAVFSTDEEAGGQTTREMVEKGYTANKMICVMDGKGYALTIAQKGVLTLTLRASGTSCHAAEPWHGTNALDNLIEGYVNIKKLFGQATADDQWQDTMAAVECRSGGVHNKVPDEAVMTVNIRYTERGQYERILKRIQEVSGLTPEVQMHSEPVVFDENTAILQNLRGCMEKRLGRNIPMQKMNGATDARHFAQCGVPVAILGIPGTDEHGEHEAAELTGMKGYEDILVDFLEAYSSQD